MSEPSMVEKVARAMCEADGFRWDARDFGETANGETPEDQRLYWRDKARAAMKEMREPTDAMIAAASGTGLCPSGVADIYIDMINAALQEGKEEE